MNLQNISVSDTKRYMSKDGMKVKKNSRNFSLIMRMLEYKKD